MRILNENEMQVVSGAGLGNFIEKQKCQGANRNTDIMCYDVNEDFVQGWKVRPADLTCAIWFCCEKNGHAAVAMGTEHYDCVTKKRIRLDVPNPQSTKNVGYTDL